MLLEFLQLGGGWGGYGSVGHRDEPSAAQGEAFECHTFSVVLQTAGVAPFGVE